MSERERERERVCVCAYLSDVTGVKSWIRDSRAQINTPSDGYSEVILTTT